MTVSSPDCYLPCGCLIHDDGQLAFQCDELTRLIHEAREASEISGAGLDDKITSLILRHTHKAEDAGRAR